MTLERHPTGQGTTEHQQNDWGDENGIAAGRGCLAEDPDVHGLEVRWLQLLRSIVPVPTSQTDTYQAVMDAIAQFPQDIPFALLYILEEHQARLKATTGTLLPTPQVIDVTRPDAPWQLGIVYQQQCIVPLTDLPHPSLAASAVEGGSPPIALCLPLMALGRRRITGFLVLGVNPQYPLEGVYHSLLELVANRVETAIAHAHAYHGEQQQANVLTLLSRTAVLSQTLPDLSLIGSTAAIDRATWEAIVLHLLQMGRESAQLKVNTILENITDAFVAFDREWRYTYVNKHACRILGRTRDELIGRNVWIEVFPELVGTDIYQNYQRALADQVPIVLESFDPVQERWVEANAYPSADGLAVYFRDITQRRQAERNLRDSEEQLKLANERFQLAARAVSALIYDWDFEQDRVERTEGLMRLTGYTVEEAEPTAQWWSERIHPDDLPRIWAEAATAIAQGDYFSSEYRVLHRNQYYIHVLDQGLVVARDEDGKPKRIVGSTIDISDRKRAEADLRHSEERYRYLAESIPQLVWTADARGAMLDVNQRWLDYTGISLTAIQQEGWQTVVHPDDCATMTQQWGVAQQNRTNYQAEGRMRRWDGVYRWHLHQAVPLMDKRGQIIKWFGTATDIEDQKQLQQQRDRILRQEQAAREDAEAANRIKDEFLAVLSHELRSPLNPILGWVKLLRHRQLDEQTRKRALETIERNAKLQSQLIEDLLDISRILRGKMVLNPAPVDFAKIIESAIETVALSADAKGIVIQQTLDPTVGNVTGDATRLQQIVWNLLSNAIKFTPEGGRVEVGLERTTTPDGAWDREGCSLPASPSTCFARLTVTDTGKGISPQFLPHLFEYFRQEDSATTRRFGGLGLGLAIVRHLTELHGGTVSAYSQGEGQGSTFTVTLPLLQHGQTLDSRDEPMGNPIDLTGLQILVVDDEADVRELLAFVLQQAGAEVTVANSATDALAAIKLRLPDLLICDIGMPGIDGYMLLRHLRSQPAQQGGLIPAIALTAYAGEMNQCRALAAGFQRHLAKPIDLERLLSTIALTFREHQGAIAP